MGVAISYGDFYLFHFFLLIFLLVSLYQIKENGFLVDFSIFKKNHVPTLMIIFIWYIISLFWAPSFELGLKYIFYIFCGIAIMISIICFSTNIASLDRIFSPETE